jgi:hypothetical protein
MKKFCVIGNQDEYERVGQLITDGYTLIAGSLSILKLLQKQYIHVVDPSEFSSAMHSATTLSIVAEQLKVIEQQVGSKYNQMLKSVLMSELTKFLLHFHYVHELEKFLGGKIYCLEKSTLIRFNQLHLPDPEYSPGRPITSSGISFLKHKPYVLNLMTATGRKVLATEANRNYFRLKKSDLSLWACSFQNFARTVFRSKNKLRAKKICVPKSYSENQPAIKMRDASSELIEQLNILVTRVVEIFNSHRIALKYFLEQWGTPEEILLNCVSGPEQAGYVAALHDYKSPIKMLSHGCMIVHGEAERQYVTSFLANSIYNFFPGVTQIFPRSPFQVPETLPDTKVVKVSRINHDKVRDQRSSKLIIYAAPNFTRFRECLYPIAMSCFDTYRNLTALSENLAARTDVELLIRVKVAAEDNVKSIRKHNFRGLTPDDLADVFHENANVTDACYGSHQKYLMDCDIVVTEGISAVLFEALEARKPVILLGKPGLSPSIPSQHLDEVHELTPRSAVYWTQYAQQIQKKLDWIASRHKDKPLQQTELEKYVWPAKDNK